MSAAGTTARQSSRRRWTLDDLQAIASERGGACVSGHYQGIDTKLAWRCADGHRWKTTPYLVIQGTWCPECAGRLPPAKMLAAMRRVARERGGRCLTQRYTKAKDEYAWRCAQGHEWWRSWDQIKGGSWCPRCVGRLPAKEALAAIKRLARERGGQCLSKRYVAAREPLELRCAEGHRWSARASDLKSGKWCSRCAGNAPLTLRDMHALAKERGGVCLAKEYRGANAPLRWRCQRGHVWSAPPSRIRGGAWCGRCAQAPRYTLQDMQAAAEKRGGRCLSRRFVTVNHHLEWQCEKGHVWRAKGGQVLSSGTWCPVCWGRQRGTITQMRELARERGGRCLSEEYVRNTSKLSWRCRLGHEWEMAPVSVKRGSWCPFCQRRGIKGIGDFLLAEHERIARERGGACLSRRYRDAQSRLRWRCQLGHEWVATAGAIVIGTWCPECAHTRQPKLEEIDALARERGGRCVSKRYVNTQTALRFECGSGHRFTARPATIKQGGWCAACRRGRAQFHPRLSIEDMHDVARERGGECVSDEYVDSRTPLTWRCGLGHEWQARPGSVRRGSWCPVCSGRRPLTLEEMQATAERRGGQCLSRRYSGVRVKLSWQCAAGHRWRAAPQSIRSGSWCPRCLDAHPDAGIARVTRLARDRGGVCLSAHHRDPIKPLRWRCARGHTWRAREAEVVAGKWCPRCV